MRSHLHRRIRGFLLAVDYNPHHSLSSSLTEGANSTLTLCKNRVSTFFLQSISEGDMLIFLMHLSLSKVGKRKLEQESHTFQEKWERAYFFVEVKSMPMCLICKKIVSVLKEYNLRRHYESKHSKSFDQYTEQTRDAILNELKKGLKRQ